MEKETRSAVRSLAKDLLIAAITLLAGFGGGRAARDGIRGFAIESPHSTIVVIYISILFVALFAILRKRASSANGFLFCAAWVLGLIR